MLVLRMWSQIIRVCIAWGLRPQRLRIGALGEWDAAVCLLPDFLDILTLGKVGGLLV